MDYIVWIMDYRLLVRYKNRLGYRNRLGYKVWIVFFGWLGIKYGLSFKRNIVDWICYWFVDFLNVWLCV